MILGVIYQDDPAAAKAFATQMSADWANLTDPDGSMANTYLVVAPPQSYFIDGKGVVRSPRSGRSRRPTSSASTRPSPPRDRGRGIDLAVEVRGLVKRYDRRTVVAGLTFDIRRGECFALLGPNGAGKTTTVEILEGYRRADEGVVRVLGLDPARDGAALRSRIGLMLQAGGVYPQARPREILRLFARFHAAPRDPDELLDVVGLSDVATTRYKVLSGGQKQRLGLALALVGRPELVVLDEPTAGMDPAAKVATRTLIGELRAAGVTVLLTTHDLADVERLADRLALIDRGRLVALGSPAELSAGAMPRLPLAAGPLDLSLSIDERVRTLRALAAQHHRSH